MSAFTLINSIGFFIGIGLSIPLIIIMVFAGSPVIQLLKSKFKGSPLILLERKDGRLGLITGDYVDGAVDNKRYGTFLTNPQAMRPFYGTALGVAYEKIGHTPSPKFIKAAANLKKNGIKDIEEAEDLEDALQGELENKDTPEEKKQVIEQILHDISYIKDYMKYNLNPSHISEKISTMIRYREGKKQRNTITLLAGLGMFMLIVAIAFYIISGQMKCPSCPSFAQVCSIAANNTRRVVSNSII